MVNIARLPRVLSLQIATAYAVDMPYTVLVYTLNEQLQFLSIQ